MSYWYLTDILMADGLCLLTPILTSHARSTVKSTFKDYFHLSSHWVIYSSNQIQYIENLPDRPTIRMINQQEWLKILNECQDQLLAVNPTPKPVDIHFIYPGNHGCCHGKQNWFSLQENRNGSITAIGTKWCGPGNVANTFDDLGTHVATDICCRDHDNCADKMSPGVCKNGLCNTSIFTKYATLTTPMQINIFHLLLWVIISNV